MRDLNIQDHNVNTEQLASWLQKRLPQIPSLNFSSQNIRVTHVLNWGGFVNHSFTIDDGANRYHLKITNDSDGIERLQRWHTIHDVLEKRYRAPKSIRCMELCEIGFAGLLFQHLDCVTANFSANPALLEKLIELADRLHNDEEIRPRLNVSGPAKTYLNHFVETYIDRFHADLAIVEAHQPPFISSRLLTWMQEETGRLQNAASRVCSFWNPAIEAVHSDLNEGNVLVTADDWFVADWDDLAIGDPAQDFAVLLWPMVWEGREWRDYFKSRPEGDFAERMEVCLRAQLLDEVIDPLADYVEARAVPSEQTVVQLVKRDRHEAGLKRYRSIWRD